MFKRISCAAAALFLSTGFAFGANHVPAAPKPPGFATMDARIGQAVEILQKSESCAAKGAVLDLLPGLVYGGTRPLPTKIVEPEGVDDEDRRIAGLAAEVNGIIAETVQRVIEPLNQLALGRQCPDQAAQAADIKFMFEETEDVAAALTEFTRQCGVGDSLLRGRCAQLRAEIDELDGHLFGADKKDDRDTIVAGYAVKLRSPFVARWIRGWEEDVVALPVLAVGECTAVFKETKGLMLRLRLAGFTVIRDPWATPNLPRGTRIPIWTLEWVPSEYVKHFNVCNHGKNEIATSVTQRIKQDDALNFFWRYYGKTRH